jgi:NhaA family Na+:H+ antiporter
MSLFIGTLAFPGRPALAEEARMGILLGSLLSAVAGYLVLRLGPARPAPIEPAAGRNSPDLEPRRASD